MRNHRLATASMVQSGTLWQYHFCRQTSEFVCAWRRLLLWMSWRRANLRLGTFLGCRREMSQGFTNAHSCYACWSLDIRQNLHTAMWCCCDLNVVFWRASLANVELQLWLLWTCKLPTHLDHWQRLGPHCSLPLGRNVRTVTWGKCHWME